jgi:hypothetical protein
MLREEKLMVSDGRVGRTFFLAFISAVFICCSDSWAEGSPPPPGNNPDTHFDKPPLPNSSYPGKPGEMSAPFQPYSYPEPSLFKEPPVLLATPGIQPSPSHFTSTGKDGVSKGVPTRVVIQTSTSFSNIQSDPKLAAEVKKYEQKSKLYQEQIDRILWKHKQDWESLSKNPADRKKCEEIMNQWRLDEKRLEALLTPKSRLNPSGTPLTQDKSRSLRTEGKTRPVKNEELNADDIDN